MALILLRHTRPQGAEGTCYGRTDMQLDDSFAAEAARLAAELPAVTRILSSPLSRCHRLAQTIAGARGLAVDLDERLIEMDFGAWENRPWDAIPRDQLDAWMRDFLGARPHGGESVQQLYDRVGAALTDAARGPVPALVVTHAGVIKAAKTARGDEGGWQSEIGFGGWVQVAWA